MKSTQIFDPRLDALGALINEFLNGDDANIPKVGFVVAVFKFDGTEAAKTVTNTYDTQGVARLLCAISESLANATVDGGNA